MPFYPPGRLISIFVTDYIQKKKRQSKLSLFQEGKSLQKYRPSIQNHSEKRNTRSCVGAKKGLNWIWTHHQFESVENECLQIDCKIEGGGKSSPKISVIDRADLWLTMNHQKLIAVKRFIVCQSFHDCTRTVPLQK